MKSRRDRFIDVLVDALMELLLAKAREKTTR